MIASLTPQSNFSEAPRTNIVENGFKEDNWFAVLPKLSVALSRVNEFLSNLVQRGQKQGNCSKDYSEEDEFEGLHPSNMGTNILQIQITTWEIRFTMDGSKSRSKSGKLRPRYKQ